MANQDIEMNMTPCHPGEFIRTEYFDELGLSVTKAAKILGVRRASLSDLLNCKTGLSPEMALRLELAFGLNMDTMLRMQAWWDAVKMRTRSHEIDVQRYEPAFASPHE